MAPNTPIRADLIFFAIFVPTPVSGYRFFPPTFPLFPAFRRMTSPSYLMPLPLYGSGGRHTHPGRSLADKLLVDALNGDAGLGIDDEGDAGGGVISTGCE